MTSDVRNGQNLNIYHPADEGAEGEGHLEGYIEVDPPPHQPQKRIESRFCLYIYSEIAILSLDNFSRASSALKLVLNVHSFISALNCIHLIISSCIKSA